RAKRAEASAARRLGTLRWPTIFTPCRSTTSPATAPSTLPPCSTARSTMTLPGRMLATWASVISRGAGRPGMRAVVMTMSCAAIFRGGIEHGLVAGEVRLGGQDVHRLRAGDARHELQRQRLQPCRGIGIDAPALPERIEPRHHQRPRLRPLERPRILPLDAEN